MINFIRKSLIVLLAFPTVALLSSFKTQDTYSARIKSDSKSELAADVWEEVSVKVQNTGAPATLRVEAVKLPAEWKISPKFLQKQMKADTSENFTFRIKAPSMTQPADIYWAVSAVYGGFLGFQKKEQQLDTLSQTINAPKIVVEPECFDFGQVYEKKVSHDFIVRNIGNSSLEIRSVTTSCGCTTAALKSQDGKPVNLKERKESPNKVGYQLAPDDSAFLTITYDPSLHRSAPRPSKEDGAFEAPAIHALQNILTKIVYIKSNDPKTPEVKIAVTIDQR